MATLYKNNPEILFDMLKQISRVNKEDISFAYSLLKELIIKIDKDKLISNFMKNTELLTNDVDDKTIIVTDLKTNSRVKILCNFLYIKINIETSKSNIFDSLRKYEKNLFLCDFKNNNYLWLNK